MAASPENQNKELDTPYCGNCGYILAGLVDSNRCPECGLPIVDVLQRKSHIVGKRYNSPTRVFGLPLISIANGPHGNEKHGHAKGIIAMGDMATGWVAFGGVARGIFAFGGVAIGLFSFGGLALGLMLACGGFALGGLTLGGFNLGGYATGGFATGIVAEGGMAFGVYARGGMARGQYVVSPRQQDPEAVDLFSFTELNIAGRPFPLGSKLHLYAMLLAFLLAVGMLIVVTIKARNRSQYGEGH